MDIGLERSADVKRPFDNVMVSDTHSEDDEAAPAAKRPARADLDGHHGELSSPARLFQHLDLATFYDVCGRNHLHVDRGVTRNAFDSWHSFMCIVTSEHASPVVSFDTDEERQMRISVAQFARDTLAAFYAWVLAGQPGDFSGDSWDCWIAAWRRRKDPLPSSERVLYELYTDLHMFLLHLEFKHKLSAHVHLVLLVHGLLSAWQPSVKLRGLEKSLPRSCTGARAIARPGAPLMRLLTLSANVTAFDVWDLHTHFNRLLPQLQVLNFFNFLSDNVESVMLPMINDLIAAEVAACSRIEMDEDGEENDDHAIHGAQSDDDSDATNV